jgi:hypothetical protein
VDYYTTQLFALMVCNFRSFGPVLNTQSELTMLSCGGEAGYNSVLVPNCGLFHQFIATFNAIQSAHQSHGTVVALSLVDSFLEEKSPYSMLTGKS